LALLELVAEPLEAPVLSLLEGDERVESDCEDPVDGVSAAIAGSANPRPIAETSAVN